MLGDKLFPKFELWLRHPVERELQADSDLLGAARSCSKLLGTTQLLSVAPPIGTWSDLL